MCFGLAPAVLPVWNKNVGQEPDLDLNGVSSVQVIKLEFSGLLHLFVFVSMRGQPCCSLILLSIYNHIINTTCSPIKTTVTRKEVWNSKCIRHRKVLYFSEWAVSPGAIRLCFRIWWSHHLIVKHEAEWHIKSWFSPTTKQLSFA